MDEAQEAAAKSRGTVCQTNAQTLHVHVHNILPHHSFTGRLTGRVVTQEDGSPLAGCEVQLFFGPIGGYPVASSRPSPQGEFCLDDLPPGFYSLRVVHAGRPVTAVYNLRVRPGETTYHPIRVPGPVTEPPGRLRSGLGFPVLRDEAAANPLSGEKPSG